METVLRALAVYALLLLIFRISGKRTLAQITTFDLVLLLIVAEAAQQALLGDDFSVTTAGIVVLTLVALDRLLDWASHRSRRLALLLEDAPVVLVEDGRLLRDRMRRVLIEEGDLLESARQLQGLERLEQIRYAVLERSGGITIVPWRRDRDGD